MKLNLQEKKDIVVSYHNTNGNLMETSKLFSHVSKWQVRNVLQNEGIYGKLKPYESEKQESRRKSLYVINFKQRKKIELVKYKGGECEKCGYNKCVAALEFHHLDPTKKEFEISGNSYSLKRLKEEADKCILICSNCHREEHYRIQK